MSPRRTPAAGSVLEVWRIAYPMMLTLLTMTAANFTDALLLSRYHTAAMSASLSALVMVYAPLAMFMELVGFVSPLTAQNLGAGRARDCGRVAWQGLIAVIAAWAVLIGLTPLVNASFTWLGSSGELAAYQREYATAYLAGSGTLLALTALGSFFSGIALTRIVMWANLAALVINVPASYLFIFGADAVGVPSLGVTGAVLGTVVGNAVGVAILLAAFLAPAMHRRFATRHPRYHAAHMRTLLRFGVPAALEAFLAPLAFAVFIQILHGLGDVQSAAATIALRYELIAYVPVVGLGIGAAACVGKYMGASDPALATRAAKSAFRVTLAYGAAMALLFGVGAPALVEAFHGGADTGGAPFDEVAPLAVTMLRLAAVYVVFDGLGVVCAHALRGAGDTRFCLRIGVLTHWIALAVPVYWFAQVYGASDADGTSALDGLAHRGAVHLWGMLIAFVIIRFAVLMARFRGGRWRRWRVVLSADRDARARDEPVNRSV